jgi:hypothetical protein
MAVNGKIRGWEVTSEGKLWPCCYFANAWDKRFSDNSHEPARLLNDEKYIAVVNEDPNWNNLDHYTLDEIVQHDFYNNYIWYPGWESDNPSPICEQECGVQVDPITKHEHARSTNDIHTLMKKDK